MCVHLWSWKCEKGKWMSLHETSKNWVPLYLSESIKWHFSEVTNKQLVTTVTTLPGDHTLPNEATDKDSNPPWALKEVFLFLFCESGSWVVILPTVTLLVTKRTGPSTHLCFLVQVICPGPPKTVKVSMAHAHRGPTTQREAQGLWGWKGTSRKADEKGGNGRGG